VVANDIYNKRKIVRMHRIIMQPPSDMEVDHKFHNRNDNRKEFLRIVTSSQNSMNVNLKSNNPSGIIGVIWNKSCKKWQPRIKVNNKLIYLGLFKNKEDAIKIRLQAEKEYFKEYAPQQHLYKEYGII
jgi:hypothetical protein